MNDHVFLNVNRDHHYVCKKFGITLKEKFATIATALTLQLYKGGSGDKDT